MTKLGWIFGPGSCAAFTAAAALKAGASASLLIPRPEVRRVVCARPTAACACPIRRTQWGYNAKQVLRRFAREVALDVIHLWDPPPVVLRYLKTGDEPIRAAARDIAWSASFDGDRGVSKAAARVAAWAAWTPSTDAADVARVAAACGTDVCELTATSCRAWETRQSRRLAKLLNSGRRIYAQKSIP